jgi:PAS domain S-box-containing protein
MELFSFPLFDDDGTVVGVIEYSRDITDRRQAEEALCESEEKFRVLAETSSVGIFLLQGDRFIYANPAIEALTGYTKDEFLNARFWDLAHPDFMEQVKEHGLARLRGEQVPSCYEIKYATKSGGEGWAELSAGLIEYKGKPTGIATVYDITRRKRAEKELEDAKAQAELYLDLMGHDINNMNQVGMGFLELALDTLSLTEDGRSLLSKPLTALQNSSRLIDNVRKLQKARSGELRRQAMDVGTVLSDVQKYYSHIPGQSVTINYTPVTGCIVMADELLYDVFSNLVGNAIKHSNRTPLISIMVEKEKGGKSYHKIIVEDNGPGISDDLKPKIFDRHLRGNTQAKGSGIGLYLVKTLVESYDGRAWVEDRVHGDKSKGSSFVILLPIYERSS